MSANLKLQYLLALLDYALNRRKIRVTWKYIETLRKALLLAAYANNSLTCQWRIPAFSLKSMQNPGLAMAVLIVTIVAQCVI